MFLFKKAKKREYLDEFTDDELRDWINGKKNKEIDSIINKCKFFLSNRQNNENFVGFRDRNHRSFSMLELDELSNELNRYINKNIKTAKLREHLIAKLEDDAIRIKEKAVFYEYYSLFTTARNLEKQKLYEEAVNIYLDILKNYNPVGLGPAYYERPCILLEKLKRYDEAIEICNLAISRIDKYNFHFPKDDFEKRLDRLIKKKNKYY